MSYLLVFLIVGALIFIHELGHFVVARLVGLPIERFSLGMGRALVSVRRGATEYRLSVFPFGGYVLPEVTDVNAYFAQPVWKRLAFTLGGPAANLLLAAAGFAVFNVYMYGLSFEAIVTAPIPQTMYAMKAVLRSIPALLTGSSEVSGLLGIVSQGGDFIGSDFLLGLQFAVVMSINLAILNMLPVPPLDGGKSILCMLEWCFDGARNLHVPLNLAGLVALIGYLGYATFLDLKRILTALSI